MAPDSTLSTIADNHIASIPLKQIQGDGTQLSATEIDKPLRRVNVSLHT